MRLGLLLVLQITAAVANSQPSDTVHHKTTWLKKVVVPAAMVTTGLIALDEDNFVTRFHIQEERQEHFPYFSSHLDDYLQYSPAALVYGLQATGVNGKNPLAEQTILLFKSEVVMASVVYLLKQTTNVQRPDHSTYNSFPSGHTAQAFVAATFLHKEYGAKSVWYSIGGYTVATAIGTFRVLNNRHWLSDVLVGGAIGILSTELVYATHQHKWSKRKARFTALPFHQQGATGFYAALHF